MNKILVEVYVPAIGRTYDMLIPCDAKVFELLPLISGVVEKLANGLFVANDTILCNGNTGTIFNKNMSVIDMELKNGSRLMLL